MNDEKAPPQRPILRFAYLPGEAAGFVLPILTRLRSATSPTLTRLSTEWADSENAADAIAVTTKLAMLAIVVTRLNESIDKLAKELDDTREVENHVAGGTGLITKDRELPIRVLVDFDAFLFEFRSCYELLGRLLPQLMKAITGKSLTEGEILAKLASEGIDVAWASTLREHRKLFFHEASPWLAVRMPASATTRRDLIFLEGPGGDTENGLTFNELRAIHAGLLRAITAFQQWLIQEIDRTEAARRAT